MAFAGLEPPKRALGRFGACSRIRRNLAAMPKCAPPGWHWLREERPRVGRAPAGAQNSIRLLGPGNARRVEKLRQTGGADGAKATYASQGRAAGAQ